MELETFTAWKKHEADLRRCVVIDKTMPPNGHPFSEAERDVVRSWIDAEPAADASAVNADGTKGNALSK